MKSQGWKEAYEGEWTEDEEEEFQTLKELEQGQRLKIDRADISAGKTQPPASFQRSYASFPLWKIQ